MAQIHKTISISQEQDKFIQEQDINLSRMVQNNIDEMRSGTFNPEKFRNLINALEKQIEYWKKVNSDAMDYMREKNVFQEFLNSKGYNYNGN